MIKKHFMLITVLLLLGGVLAFAQIRYMKEHSQSGEEEIKVEHPILIWYTDPDIQSFMEASAREMTSRYEVEVRAELVSEVDYIENICEKSVAEQMEGPDVYVASSALLEKAALAGLTTPVKDEELAETYSEKAVQAVTYNGTVAARPFYIETCFLLYNNYYVNAEEVPDTIDGILAYAEEFEADEVTERVESIFKWNVADVIDNYMFLGAYTDLGGESGDDKSRVSMDLEQITECMNYYQSLNSYFAIDADTVTSEEIIREFIDGKTVFTIVNVPMLAELDRAIAAGEIPEYPTEHTVVNEDGEETTVAVSYDSFYQVAPLPALTDELDTRGLSVTNGVVVNPYSLNVDSANACARYLTEERAGKLYEEAGKMTACKSFLQNSDADGNKEEKKEKKKSLIGYQSLYDMLLGEEESTSSAETKDAYLAVYEAYEQAAEVPKIMELSNIWLQLEVVLADIWRGADSGEKLSQFSKVLAAQLD